MLLHYLGQAQIRCYYVLPHVLFSVGYMSPCAIPFEMTSLYSLREIGYKTAKGDLAPLLYKFIGNCINSLVNALFSLSTFLKKCKLNKALQCNFLKNLIYHKSCKVSFIFYKLKLNNKKSILVCTFILKMLEIFLNTCYYIHINWI